MSAPEFCSKTSAWAINACLCSRLCSWSMTLYSDNRRVFYPQLLSKAVTDFGVANQKNGALFRAPLDLFVSLSGTASVRSIKKLFRGRGRNFLLDWRANQVSPLCPRAVVVAHILDSHEVLEYEPGVRAALADAAVSNNFAVPRDALRAVELLQRVEVLERSILVDSLRPGNICRTRNMSRTLRCFAHAGRRDDFPCEFIHGAHIDKLSPGFLLDGS